MATEQEFQQFVDNLGKMVTSASNSVGVLANAMNAAVTKISGTTAGTGAVEKLVELITGEEKKIENFNEILKVTMPEAFKELKIEMDKVKDEFTAMDTALKNIKNNSGGSRRKSTISNPTTIPTPPSGGSGDPLKRECAYAEELINDHKKLKKSADVEIKYSRKMWGYTSLLEQEIEDMVDEIGEGNLAWDESNTSIDEMSKKLDKLSHLTRGLSDDLTPSVKGPLKKAMKEYAQSLRDFQNGVSSVTEEGLIAQEKELTALIKKTELWEKRIPAAADMITNAASGFAKKMIGGFMQDGWEMERTATHLAAKLNGVNRDGGGGEIVDRYKKVLEISQEVADMAHLDGKIIDKQVVKAIDKGTRSIEETRDVMVDSQILANQIGSSAEGTADEFQKWNMNIGISAKESTALARSVSATGKITGVMGDNLLKAVSAASEIALIMKDTGLYSQQTADSVVRWMAAAQKFGVDKEVKKIFEASQGGLEGFMEASQETRNLIAASGQASNVMGGNADPEEVMKGVVGAFKNIIPPEAFERNEKGETIGVPDMKKLNKGQISLLSLTLKKKFGIKFGTFQRILDAELAANPEKALEAVQARLKRIGEGTEIVADAELESLKAQEKELEGKKAEKELGKAMDLLNGINEDTNKLIAKGIETDAQRNAIFAETLRKLKTDKAGFEKAIDKSTEVIAKNLKDTGKDFQKETGKSSADFAAEMKRLHDEGLQGNRDSLKAFLNMQAKLEGLKKVATSEAKSASNVQDKLERDMLLIKNALVNNVAGPLSKMLMQMPPLVFYAAAIAGVLTKLYLALRKGKLEKYAEETANSVVGLGIKGSAYTEDIHLAKILNTMRQEAARRHMELKKMSKKGGGGGAAKEATEKIKGKTGKPEAKLPGNKVKGGDAIMKGAAKLIAIAAAVVALGLVLVLAAQRLKHMGFDAKAAGETMIIITVLLAVAAETLLVAAGAIKLIEYANKMLDGKSIKEVYIAGAKLALLIPGFILLGLAILGIGALISLALTPEKAMLYAAVVTALIVAVTIIAWAIVFGVQALIVLGAMAEAVKVVGPLILFGVVAFLVMGVVMALLAAAVVWLGEKVLSNTVDPKKAMETAKATAEIMLAAGLIAGAVVLASVSLMVLGVFAVLAWGLSSLIILGVAGLRVLTPAMVNLAVSIVNMAENLNKGIDLAAAKETAQHTADIMMAAGKIAGSVVAASAFLMGLGAFAIIAWQAAPLMATGAAVLFMLTPQMVRLATAIIKMAAGLANAGMVEEGKTAAENLTSVMESAAKISKAVVDSKAALESLAPGWKIFTKMNKEDTMKKGSEQLMITTPQTVALASAIIYMAKEQTAATGEGDIAKDGVKAAADLGAVLKAAGDIAKGVSDAKEAMKKFDDSGWMSQIFKMCDDHSMEKGAEALTTLTPDVVRLSRAIIGMAKANTQNNIAKDGVKAAADLGAVLKAAGDIAKGVMDSKESLEKLGTKSWLDSIRVMTKEEVMEMGAEALTMMTPDVVRLACAIIGMAKANTQNNIAKDGVKAAADLGAVLKAAGDIAKGVMDSKKTLQDLNRMVAMQSYWDKVMGRSETAITDMASGIIEGIIKPIMNELPPSDQMKDTGAKLKGTIEALGLLPRFFDDLSGKMKDLKRAMDSNRDLDKNTAKFSWWFYSISSSLQDGIFKPLMSFPEVSEVITAIDTLSELTNALSGLMEIMYELSNTLQEMGQIDIDFSSLENVGGIFKSGEMDIVVQAKDPGTSRENTGADTSSDDFYQSLLGVFTGRGSPPLNQNAGMLRGMKRGYSASLEKPMATLNQTTGKVGKGVVNLGGSFTKFNKQDIAGAINDLGKNGLAPLNAAITGWRTAYDANRKEDVTNVNAIKDKLTKISAAVATSALTSALGKKKADLSAEAIASLEKEATSGTSLDTHDHSTEDILNRISPHVERIAAAAMAQEETAKGVMNKGDFDKQVQAKVEQSKPSETMKASMEYLIAIAANTAATNESVKEAVEVLEEIKNNMGSSDGGGAKKTKKSRKPDSPANFHRWSGPGDFGNSSFKQYV